MTGSAGRYGGGTAGKYRNRRDAGGPEWTREDGDLRLYTLVDGLPLDGMQEVRSSNLLSSTLGVFPQVRSLASARTGSTCRTD